MELEPNAKDPTEFKCRLANVNLKGSPISKRNILNHVLNLQKLLLPISNTNPRTGIRTKCKR